MSRKGFPGKSLSNTQTCSSKGSYAPRVDLSGKGEHTGRGARKEPVKGTELPGKGMTRTQTRNSPSPRIT